jgi:hypothetical protein
MFFAQHHRCALPWDIRRPSAIATRRTDTDPIGVHIFVWFEAPFVFHMNHSDVFCTPPLLRTAVGHPPTFHMNHSDVLCE